MELLILGLSGTQGFHSLVQKHNLTSCQFHNKDGPISFGRYLSNNTLTGENSILMVAFQVKGEKQNYCFCLSLCLPRCQREVVPPRVPGIFPNIRILPEVFQWCWTQEKTSEWLRPAKRLLDNCWPHPHCCSSRLWRKQLCRLPACGKSFFNPAAESRCHPEGQGWVTESSISFRISLMDSDCSVWKFQASFDLLQMQCTFREGMKGCYPTRNLTRTLAEHYMYECLPRRSLKDAI